MYPSVTYFQSAFVAVVYVCLTRDLEAISDLSEGIHVKVRDCDICKLVTVLNAAFEDYKI